jgi:hypothetical protein
VKIAQSDTAEIVEFAGAPGRVRTSNPRFRRPILYPVELRAHKAFFEAGHKVGTTSMTATIYHYVGKRQAKRGHSVAVMAVRSAGDGSAARAQRRTRPSRLPTRPACRRGQGGAAPPRPAAACVAGGEFGGLPEARKIFLPRKALKSHETR